MSVSTERTARIPFSVIQALRVVLGPVQHVPRVDDRCVCHVLDLGDACAAISSQNKYRDLAAIAIDARQSREDSWAILLGKDPVHRAHQVGQERMLPVIHHGCNHRSPAAGSRG